MEQNRINTGRDLSRDSTKSPDSPKELKRIRRCKRKLGIIATNCYKLMLQIGLIEVHEEAFEKVAAVKVTIDTAHTAQEIIENIKTCLNVI